MKNIIYIILATIIFIIVTACADRTDEQAVKSQYKSEQKTIIAGNKSNSGLAKDFLQGLQENDKQKMYSACNLSQDLVNICRERLIYATKNKLTEQQRKESEHALRTSGQIDFFVSKLKKLLPKSSRFEITETFSKEATKENNILEHTVHILYTNKDEAMYDKTSRPIKEMIVHLQQINMLVDEHTIHEFSFSSKDFDKMADRDFEVVSYYQ